MRSMSKSARARQLQLLLRSSKGRCTRRAWTAGISHLRGDLIGVCMSDRELLNGDDLSLRQIYIHPRRGRRDARARVRVTQECSVFSLRTYPLVPCIRMHPRSLSLSAHSSLPHLFLHFAASSSLPSRSPTCCAVSRLTDARASPFRIREAPSVFYRSEASFQNRRKI